MRSARSSVSERTSRSTHGKKMTASTTATTSTDSTTSRAALSDPVALRNAMPGGDDERDRRGSCARRARRARSRSAARPAAEAGSSPPPWWPRRRSRPARRWPARAPARCRYPGARRRATGARAAPPPTATSTSGHTITSENSRPNARKVKQDAEREERDPERPPRSSRGSCAATPGGRRFARREEHPREQVDRDAHAARRRRRHERDAHDDRVDPDVAREPGAHAAEHPVLVSRRRTGAGRGRAGRVAIFASMIPAGGV